MMTEEEAANIERIREKAIRVAESLVERRHLGLDNLAAEMDCSLTELGSAIGSLDQLILVINGRTMDRLIHEIDGVVDGVFDPHQAILRICQCYLDFAQKNDPFVDYIFHHRWPENFSRPEWYLEKVAHCFHMLESRLKALCPEASPEQTSLGARSLWSVAYGVYWLNYNRRLDKAGIHSQNQLLGYSVRAFLRGYLNVGAGEDEGDLSFGSGKKVV